MKNRIFIFALIALFSASCIEPIDFPTGGESRRLVVEGLISNISFNERFDEPADPFPFYVRLGYTSDVGNSADQVIPDARVTLYSSEGGEWVYGWSSIYERYLLLDADFRAMEGVGYSIEIVLSNGEVYTSEVETMTVSPDIGALDFYTETRVQVIENTNGTEIIEQRGVNMYVDVPSRAQDDTYYYRWNVTPSWIFEASLADPASPRKTCYVTNRFFFDKVNVGTDRAGGYTRDLIFVETDGNNRIQHQYSALVTQYSLSKAAYTFWDEIAIQQQSGGGIFDPPPFELSTNIQNVGNPAEKISGFFMVAYESSERWYFSPADLPYGVDFPDDCRPPPGTPSFPTPDCFSCLEYRGGSSSNTNVKPEWWIEN